MGTANIPRVWVWNLFEYSDDLNYTLGRHSLKGGFLFKRMQFNQRDSLNAGGDTRFRSLRDFVRGVPQSITVLQPGANQTTYWRYNYIGWYVQDDYYLSSRCGWCYDDALHNTFEIHSPGA